MEKKYSKINGYIKHFEEELKKEEKYYEVAYKDMIIEWVETEYQGLEDTNEFKNIMKNIDKIVKNVFPKIDNNLTIEEELNIVWEEINKYKNV